MGVLFSRITAITDTKAAIFLVSGIPSSQSDLEGWSAFQSFTEDLKENDLVTIHTETFVYGSGPVYDATPEEVAYVYMRCEKRPDFIEARTKKISESGFSLRLLM